MLPTLPDQDMLEAITTRFLAYYDGATKWQRARGLAWYPVAHDLALMLGDLKTGAGLIAALSANKRWTENVRLAEDASNGNIHGHTGRTLGKVRAILEGTDPAEVLPMDLKTGQFYLAIMGDPEAVVIDRHIHDIAAGETYGDSYRGLSAKRRYQSISLALRTAAYRRNISPRDFQAILWVRRMDEKDGN